MRIVVLYNLPDLNSARSDVEMAAELEVLETVEGVKKSLESIGHEAIPLKCSMEILQNLHHFDAVFNLAEGFQNDLRAEPYVAGALELQGLPYTGSPPPALELCRNKYLSKMVLERVGIKTPRFQLFKHGVDSLSLDFPVIVKPALEDASIGITYRSLATDQAELKENVCRVLKNYRQPALVEEYIDGREMNAALIGEGESAEVLPISEIVFDLPPDMPRILGFEAKWLEDSPFYQNSVPLCPAPLSPSQEDEINELTKEACSALGVENYARVDFRVRDEEAFVIEVNPNPCINPIGSGFARAATAAGMSYAQLVQKILDLALLRRGWKIEDAKAVKAGEVFVMGDLTFKRAKASDVPLLFKWFRDSKLTKYMEPFSSTSEDQLLLKILDSKDEDFVVCKGYVPIGFASLYNNNGCCGEISYLIGEADYRGKGWGKTMAKAMVSYGLEGKKLKSLFATCTMENLPSIKTLKGTGFKEIGRRRSYFPLEHQCLDEILFDINAKDLPTSQSEK